MKFYIICHLIVIMGEDLRLFGLIKLQRNQRFICTQLSSIDFEPYLGRAFKYCLSLLSLLGTHFCMIYY